MEQPGASAKMTGLPMPTPMVMTEEPVRGLCEKPGQSVRADLHKHISNVSEDLKTFREATELALKYTQNIFSAPNHPESFCSTMHSGKMRIMHRLLSKLINLLHYTGL